MRPPGCALSQHVPKVLLLRQAQPQKGRSEAKAQRLGPKAGSIDPQPKGSRNRGHDPNRACFAEDLGGSSREG